MRSATPARIAVMASGGGSNLQALIDHFAVRGAQAGIIVLALSDKSTAGALDRARAAGIAVDVIHDPADGSSILSKLEHANVDMLILAGYLKLVPAEVIRRFEGCIINVHPALLPAFGGPGMYGQRIHKAVIEHGVKVTGVTVHFVDEHYDRGPIIAQWPVPVLNGDTPESVAARVLRVEHRLLPACAAAVAEGRIMLDSNNRVVGELAVRGSELVNNWKYTLAPDTGDSRAGSADDENESFFCRAPMQSDHST